MNENYFMGQDGFAWFVGVVEDRDDPDKLGRVRVRCLGYHTEDLNKIPTETLPWAEVMHPITNPSMNGMGNTPPFMVEGTWVIGFFKDAIQKQEPIIMGTLPGYNKNNVDTTKGFSDPKGIYPKVIGDNDTNSLARGAIGETHQSLYNRRITRLTSLPIATKPFLETIEDYAEAETRSTFDEPNPKSNSATIYPYNHVHESESGHIHEIDDSPGGERLLKYHRVGTFEEIHPDGTVVTKIVKDNYQITAGNDFCYIKGNVNLTVEGDVRNLIKGDYVLEVEGDYTEKLHKNKYIKIGAGESGGNLGQEIRGNVSENISEDYITRIGENYIQTIEKDLTSNINGAYDISIMGDSSSFVMGDMTSTSFGSYLQTSIGAISMKSGDVMNIKAADNLTIETEANEIHTVAGTLSETITGAITETYNSSLTTAITGATIQQYKSTSAFYFEGVKSERVEENTKTTRVTGKTDFTTTTTRTGTDNSTVHVAGL